MKPILSGILVRTIGIAIVLAMPFLVALKASAVDVNDFSISTYAIEYQVARDVDNRSVLKTTETIVADFRVANQNRGIERAIPTKYDGHPTSLEIESVTDGEGKARQYSTSTDNDNEVLRIGNPDSYVQGIEVYKITYTQRDVTRFYADTDRDEWYWDTNGTEWQVPIDHLTITAKIDAGINGSRLGQPSCYKGIDTSNTPCNALRVSDTDYTVTVSNLAAGENVTLAFGFKPGTFAQYEPTLFERIAAIWAIVTLITGVIGVIVVVWLIVVYYRRYNRSAELHIVPVQYIPPKNTSVIIASQVVTPIGSVFGAQLIDFAVRHIISIIETKPKGAWTLAEYDIKMLRDPAKLLEEEREILKDMFDGLPKIGDKISLSSLRNNTGYYKRTADNNKKIKRLIEGEYALRHASKSDSKLFYNWSIALLIIGLLTVSIPLLVISGVVALFGVSIRPLTDSGLEVRRYLLGLSTYIKAAEAERLKYLQGPDTAQKVGETVNVDNQGQIVKLYERVLPYAILFGHEKQWTKQLSEYYQAAQSSPDWYIGSTAFNAALFAGVISNFSSAASYSGGASASTGGSSGGGSSGGGGGGGGGGGW